MILEHELKIGIGLTVLFLMIVTFLVASDGWTIARVNTEVLITPTQTIPTPAIVTSTPTPTVTSVAATPTPTKAIVISTPTPSQLNAAQVAKHNTRSDCWIIIRGNVYNVTDYLSSHPGGASQLLPYCGADATKAYEDVRKHRAQAEAELAILLVGPLK